MRQALGGLLWSKQFYHYVVAQWLQGDPAFPSPPPQRWQGRNRGWLHLYNDDVISMPDKWEYPWYAAWDLAFHCIPLQTGPTSLTSVRSEADLPKGYSRWNRVAGKVM
jgi:hypothetical protein